jgi:hypothetical protein
VTRKLSVFVRFFVPLRQPTASLGELHQHLAFLHVVAQIL